MKLPWISREAYVDMRDERDRLLALVERQTQAIIALKRREAGMPEREAAPRPEPVTMTPAILRACDMWGDASSRRAEALRMLQAGKGEAEVLAALTGEEA